MPLGMPCAGRTELQLDVKVVLRNPVFQSPPSWFYHATRFTFIESESAVYG